METKDYYYINKTKEYISNRLYLREIDLSRAIEIIKGTSILTMVEKIELIEDIQAQYKPIKRFNI